jgi:hypothetical protein
VQRRDARPSDVLALALEVLRLAEHRAGELAVPQGDEAVAALNPLG